MGNVLGGSSNTTGSSSSNNVDTIRRRKDIQSLCERVSFGDDEISQFYDSYLTFQQFLQSTQDTTQQEERQEQVMPSSSDDININCSRNIETSAIQSPQPSSFFYDWYTAILLNHNTTTGSSTRQGPLLLPHQQFQLDTLQNVILNILPLNFDNALYCTCFIVSDDANSQHRYDDHRNCNSATGTAITETTTINTATEQYMDEYTRTTCLYKFFDALSVCNGRRASKDSITMLFDTVHALQQQQQPPPPPPHNDTATTISNIQQNDNVCVSARFFVETGYRIALSLAYIEQQHEELLSLVPDDDNDQVPVVAQNYKPIFNAEAEASLQAMAMSIVEKRKKRQRQLPVFNSSRQSSLLSSSFSVNDPSAGTTTTNDIDHANENDTIELIDVLEWMETVAPMFPYIVPTLFNYLLFPNTTMTTTTTTTSGDAATVISKVLGRTTFSIPRIINIQSNRDNTTSSTTTTTTNDTLLHPAASSLNDASLLLSVRHFIVTCYGTSLNGYYYPIYNSNNDGLSFNRLQNAILGYGGPTLFIMQSVSGGIFGAYTGTSWKESKDFYGNTDSFLYQLKPQVALYRPKSNGSTGNYMYCNSTARSRGYDQQAHGIGFGGTVQQPRLFISENFDDGCTASSQDLTYDNGPLLPSVGTSGHYNSSNSRSTATIQSHRSIFDIECIEVYGVSDNIDVIDMAIGSRTLNRANKEELIRKARKVDKAQFLDDFQSGIISSKAFVHRQQMDGRADDDCLLKQEHQPE